MAIQLGQKDEVSNGQEAMVRNRRLTGGMYSYIRGPIFPGVGRLVHLSVKSIWANTVGIL